MVVDDNDDPKPAPAETEQAEPKTAETPTEPEGDEPEGEPEAEATAEGEEPSEEADDEEEDEGEGGDEPPKRKSRQQRYREQAERLRAENEALRARTSEGLPSDTAQLQRAFEYAVWQEIGDPPNPADPQFKDDYVALAYARQAWETDRRQVTRQVREKFRQSIAQEQERVANQVADHKERVGQFKKGVKDYDEVMARATLPVAPHVERLLLESKRSAQLSYVLAKDQSSLARLNRMNPEAAAREIGRLEGRLSLPKPKTQTQARKPITPLKGGGTAPASSPTAQVNAMIKKMYGPRAV